MRRSLSRSASTSLRSEVYSPGAGGARAVYGSVAVKQLRPPSKLTRFKQASAAKRRDAAQSNLISQEDIDLARRADPRALIESLGYTAKGEGRHISVRLGREEIARVTEQRDGRYVACTKEEQGIGDNIALARFLDPSLSFRDAVTKITGVTPPSTMSAVRTETRRPNAPRLPHCEPAHRDAGRRYLQDVRGIRLDVIEHAEASGMLRYSNGAVLFVGYDPGSSGDAAVRNVTRRAIDPAAEIQKRDLRGSDKRYPPILPGNPMSVWIVEGGVDALALQSMSRKSGIEPPTVIVSGGAGVRNFLEMPHVRAFLKPGVNVTIAAENEKDWQTQRKTDDDRKKQAARIRPLIYVDVEIWRPDPEYKDLADMNLGDGQTRSRRPMF